MLDIALEHSKRRASGTSFTCIELLDEHFVFVIHMLQYLCIYYLYVYCNIFPSVFYFFLQQ